MLLSTYSQEDRHFKMLTQYGHGVAINELCISANQYKPVLLDERSRRYTKFCDNNAHRKRFACTAEGQTVTRSLLGFSMRHLIFMLCALKHHLLISAGTQTHT